MEQSRTVSWFVYYVGAIFLMLPKYIYVCMYLPVKEFCIKSKYLDASQYQMFGGLK